MTAPGECPGCAIHKRDPLADVLRRAQNDFPSGWGSEWEWLARAAREHIAAEIEAVEDAQPPMLRASLGLREAARIARGLK